MCMSKHEVNISYNSQYDIVDLKCDGEMLEKCERKKDAMQYYHENDSYHS